MVSELLWSPCAEYLSLGEEKLEEGPYIWHFLGLRSLPGLIVSLLLDPDLRIWAKTVSLSIDVGIKI